ncbi:hypothetical protein TPHA_0A00660 [Tetrapisispora phaffii CBS 4417]|uniref:Uncharacterized protein n=1 Tax=Tetrapisispora phaffii (strain ATCC 24235 / CBS 4417 / NBRC 1672 / NRRL Y-8282 / UCD 70-5) TaxID=1071381 RepID=G8BMM3_TETPH|nr:hypothetical protein TPHA_0A00660 [Tetrapisispora phaffii CBS 4417]CCE61151.1 hypothetical protein TPHA_0A00660 [Tetrapisispora phaffii CBS 4417]
MDRLKELEKKRKQLQELRERRKDAHNATLLNKLQEHKQTENTRSTAVEMVTISVQTESIDSSMESMTVGHDSSQLSKEKGELITFDKSIQTDSYHEFEVKEPIDLTKNQIGESQEELMELDANVQNDIEKYDSKSLKDIEYLYPMLMKTDYKQNTDQLTFSIIELMDSMNNESVTNKINQNAIDIRNGDSLKFINKIESQIPKADSQILNSIAIDSYGPLLAVLYVCKPMMNGSLSSITSSYVEVHDYHKSILIDRVEFQGQSLVTCKFLRKRSHSKVTSLLLTALSGKIYLYEIKAVTSTELDMPVTKVKFQRNIIYKNYHYAPVYAIFEYNYETNKFSSFSDDRFLSISNVGALNEISSLDLSLYVDNSPVSQCLHNIIIQPPRRAALISYTGPNKNLSDELIDNDDYESDTSSTEDETRRKFKNKSHKEITQEIFLRNLQKVSLYSKLTVLKMAVSIGNENFIYVGTEDGGIYKLSLNDIKDDKLTVSLFNNNFLPVEDDTSFEYLFHSSPVTSLTINKSNYLLSTSLDWTCKLWDTITDMAIGKYNFNAPVLQGEWIYPNSTNRSSIFTACISWQEFTILKWDLKKSPFTNTDNMTFIKTELSKQPEVILRITNELVSFEYFTNFKLINNNESDNDGLGVILGGDKNYVSIYNILLFSVD